MGAVDPGRARGNYTPRGRQDSAVFQPDARNISDFRASGREFSGSPAIVAAPEGRGTQGAVLAKGSTPDLSDFSWPGPTLVLLVLVLALRKRLETFECIRKLAK